ncbi:E3 ubiquitin-protein ligase At4g11680-like [Bidens hawaiensis]|uniref:E3 ubiquitin-protein ligase At4g11680-like n=1 Tax=Bidens hawaiensis TaxID=980011 RepID=UPI00404AE8E7
MSQFTGRPPPPPVSPLNSVYLIAIDLVITMIQALAIIIVLAISTHEKAPLLWMWVLVYLSGHIPYISLLVYRYRTRHIVQHNARIVQQYFRFALHCFFGIWFIFGCILVFVADPSIANQAPNIYRLCVALLILSGIVFALPGVYCFAACFCCPCLLILQELLPRRGARKRSIRSLPTYRFEGNESGGGVVNQRVVSEEDAVCSICLERYENGNELKNLPCNHVFHKDCVEQWLRLNPECPLCKAKTGKRLGIFGWLCTWDIVD